MKLPWPFRRRPSLVSPDPDERIEATVRELMQLRKPELAKAVVAAVRETEDVVDVLTLQRIERTSTTANPYNTRQERIEQLAAMYAGTESWGCGLVKRLVNIRRALQMPHGLEVGLADGVDAADDELAFIRDLLDLNNLAEGRAQRLVKHRELEGQLLVELVWSESRQQVVLRPRLWRSMHYDVTLVNEDDPVGPRQAPFYGDDGQVVYTLEDDQFAFVAFNDDGESLEGTPEIGDVLWYCENADKLLFAWRKFNNLFAYLTPFFKTEDQQTADRLHTLIQSIGWKIGMAVAANADFKMVGPQTTSVGLLMHKELVATIQVICGLTGVEPQDLGFPDILSNRAVATEMGEPQEIVTNADITAWRGFFEELFIKAVRLRNLHLHGQLREDAVVAKIMPATSRQYNLVKEILLPAAEKGLIDVETFLEQLPRIDKEQTLERLAGDLDKRRGELVAQLNADAQRGLM